jgi:hypothetical protein
VSIDRIVQPARPHVEAQWLARRCARVALPVLPFVLLLCCQLQLPGVLHTFERVIGGLTLIVVPGYILLWVLGLDPLAADAPGYRWPLVVPLSLAIGVLLGTFLVLTPIGLSACSLWGGLSVLAAMSFLGARWL